MAKNVTIYGIKNCKTMKKAFVWLDKRNISYAFHDYKKQGADEQILKTAIKRFGWENVLNRKGMTWKKLPQSARDAMTEKSAIATAMDNPSLIKRPLIVADKTMLIGFDETAFETLMRG